MIDVAGLTKTYGSKRALTDVTFGVPKGGAAGLLGANGAGKSTLLGILTGAIHADEGRALLRSEPESRPNCTRIGSTLERPGFAPELSIRRNLEIIAAHRRIDAAWVARVLDAVALSRKELDRFGTLSTGQQQRTALAAALMGSPTFLLLDEPWTGVDAEGRQALRDVYVEARDRGSTLLISSHETSELEGVTTHVVSLMRGRCVAAGPMKGSPFLEVRGSDMWALEHALRSMRGVDVVPHRDGLRVHTDVPASDILRHLSALGLYPDQIVQRRRTLESFYGEVTR